MPLLWLRKKKKKKKTFFPLWQLKVLLPDLNHKWTVLQKKKSSTIGEHDTHFLGSPNPMMTTIKKENQFHFKLFGKFLLFADTVIWSSIHRPQSITASSLTEKSCEKQAMVLRESLLYKVVVSQLSDGCYSHTGNNGKEVATHWRCQILVLLSTYWFSFTHWSEQIAINLKLRYKYTQICTVHVQENIFAFVTSVTLKILESWYLCHWFAC